MCVQANSVLLQIFCAVARSAQNVSAAVGEAALSAIPQSFGSQPCNFFQGTIPQLYGNVLDDSASFTCSQEAATKTATKQ